jgi:hypothetical protein
MNGWQIVFLILSAGFAFMGFRCLRDWAGVPSDVARYFLAALIAMLFVALTACATPSVKTETVEVKVPVAVQPITPAQVPTPPAPLGPRPSSLSAAADALFAQVCKLEAYVLRADPLLRVSAGEKATELPKYPECEGR